MNNVILICCGTRFNNPKGLSNHKRWCGGKIKYKPTTYHGVHAWVRRHKIKPKFCEKCAIAPPRDLANKSGKYLRDINDYDYLCRSCHKKQDRTEQVRKIMAEHAKGRARNERGMFQ